MNLNELCECGHDHRNHLFIFPGDEPRECRCGAKHCKCKGFRPTLNAGGVAPMGEQERPGKRKGGESGKAGKGGESIRNYPPFGGLRRNFSV